MKLNHFCQPHRSYNDSISSDGETKIQLIHLRFSLSVFSPDKTTNSENQGVLLVFVQPKKAAEDYQKYGPEDKNL